MPSTRHTWQRSQPASWLLVAAGMIVQLYRPSPKG
jgi:hypothetical protein